MDRCRKCVPPSARPPTPTVATRPPEVDRLCASSTKYTSSHVAPGPTLTTVLSSLTTMSFKPDRSIVTPPSMFAAPANAVCPPLRMAKSQPEALAVGKWPATKVRTETALETSATDWGRTIQAGSTASSWYVQYDSRDSVYAVVFGYDT